MLAHRVLVELVELSGPEVPAALRINAVDLALASEPQKTDGFVVEELWREKWSLILPEDPPLFRNGAGFPADPSCVTLPFGRSSAQKAVLAPSRPARA